LIRNREGEDGRGSWSWIIGEIGEEKARRCKSEGAKVEGEKTRNKHGVYFISNQKKRLRSH
jgi:hypothetical protein